MSSQGRKRRDSNAGYERKVSVLDDNASSNGHSNNKPAVSNDIKEKLANNKGVRDMHFEIAFD